MKELAMSSEGSAPIFIHSLWRAGSTYMFDKIRRHPGNFFTLQESIHEITLAAVDNKDKLTDVISLDPLLNHPKLDEPYFFELFKIFDCWKDEIDKSLIYDQYFDKNGSSELKSYIGSIIEHSQGRPVFQECRTSGRIGAMKTLFGGVHIFLLRNPHDQWWSMLKDHYFGTVLLMVANAKDAPPSLKSAMNSMDVSPISNNDIFHEIDYFDEIQLNDAQNYELFLFVWIFAIIEARRFADLVIDMDRLARNDDFRELISLQIQEKTGINGLDLTDAKIPVRKFRADEISFFQSIEEKVLEVIALDPEYSEFIPELRTVIQSYRNTGEPESEVYELRRVSRHLLSMGAKRLDDCRKRYMVETDPDTQDKLNKALAQSHSKIATLELELSATRAAFATSQTRLDEATAEALHLQGMLDDSNERLGQMQKTLADTTEAQLSERQTAGQRQAELNEKIGALDRTVSATRARLTQLKAIRRTDLEAVDVRLTALTEQSQRECATLQKHYTAQLADLEKRYAAEIETVKAEHVTEQARQSKRAADEAASARQDLLEVLTRTTTSHTAALDAKIEHIRDIEHDNISLKQQLGILQRRLEEIEESRVMRVARRLYLFPTDGLTKPAGAAIEVNDSSER